jgi:hypothetical protein
MARGKWWPASMPAQRAKMLNFKGKIGTYEAQLNWTPVQTTAAQTLCDAYMHAYDFADSVESSAEAVTNWRNNVFRGKPQGGAIPPAPVVPVGTPNPGTLGVVTQFFELRDEILANKGFTEAMGEDLEILGPIIADAIEEDVVPALTFVVKNGYRVDIIGSMKKNPQIRIEWRAKGSDNWVLLTFLTNLPAEVIVTPGTPGEPQSGHIRAVFYRKNQEYGVFSPDYPLTVIP